MRSKHLGRALGAVVSVAAILAILAPAAQATKPKPPYEQFAGCPSIAEYPAVSTCIHSVVTGGHFKMGNKEVPIENPIPGAGTFESSISAKPS